MTVATQAAALLRLLRHENTLLEAMDLSAAAALASDKQSMIISLSGLRPAPSDRSVLDTLASVAADNQRLLRRALSVQRRVIEIVARAAQRSLTDPRYGARGAHAMARQDISLALSTRA